MYFTLKIAFCNFFPLRKDLLNICSLAYSLHLLRRTKHRICVLRSSKKVILCI